MSVADTVSKLFDCMEQRDTVFIVLGIFLDIFVRYDFNNCYEGRCESNGTSFFSENVIAITVKFTWIILKSSAVMNIFF
jgi:hypothetical protein